MLDFFETLQIATLMAIRDYYKEKDKQKQRVADFNQQCIEGVANASSRLCDIIVDTSTKAFGDSTPKSVADGIYNLPFYAMLNVSRKQGGISLNQQKVLDIFFRNLNTSYNKIDFINAVNNRGNLENILYESVGLNGSKVGEFWSQFFSALRVTQCAQNILSEIIDCYSEIVMNFAFLNTNGESVTNSIVKEFINNVSNQYEVSFSNKDNIDFAGEKSFLQHKADLETLSWKIIQKSGDQGELDMKELLDNLFMSVLIGLSDLSNEPINKKAEILDYLLNISGVDTFETGYTIYQQIYDNFQLRDFFSNFPSQFIAIIGIMGTKADLVEEAGKVPKKLCDYVIGIEKELSSQYPFAGYGNKATGYCSDILEKAMNN